MNTESIIDALDTEIARLQEVKSLLTATSRNSQTGVFKGATGRPKKAASVAAPTKRTGLSPEARERIAEAQRARWAKVRRDAKKAAKEEATA
jgi:hypothetical protein